MGMNGVALDARASLMIEVSQESAAGAGDFDANVLGFINPFITGLTIAGFYQYGVPNGASYNGELNGGPLPVSSLTQGFFVEASDGVHYVIVHDNPNDGSGGNTAMTTTLIGGAGGGAAFTVEDDIGEGTTVSDVAADRIFDTTHGWVSCCTDGYAIGSLLGSDVLYAQFDAGPTGISSWQSTGNAQPNISMVIDPGRRVRYQLVPEPATIMLMGLGLAGLGFARWRRMNA
jgi:hypothetical protein